jgi:hypothetical protein
LQAVRARPARISSYEQTPTVSIGLAQPRLPATFRWRRTGTVPHISTARRITRIGNCALERRAEAREARRDRSRHASPGGGLSRSGSRQLLLERPTIATIAQDTLLFHDQTKYRLAAWVVMPNHAHVLCSPCMGHSLAETMHALKSYWLARLIRCSVAVVDFGRRNTSIATFAMRDISQR